MPLICPTDAEIAARLAALRPRGRAWRHAGEDALEGSVMGRFFDALGAGFGPTERRLCDLVEEFFCSTALETLDLWRLEYGLPDPCDPFADPCEKANAVGDTTTDYVIGVAARRGWAITIREEFIVNAQDAAFGIRRFGAAIFGAQTGVAWFITVDLAASPAYAAPAARSPVFGHHLFGDGFDCPPDIAPLVCLVRRIAPAHADLDFVTIN